MYSDYVKISVMSLRQRKVRTWLTMLGIFIGIAAVVSMISLGQGLKKAINEQFNVLGANKLFIGLKSEQNNAPGGSGSIEKITDKDIKIVQRAKGVSLVTGYLYRRARLEFNDEIKYVQALGMPLDPDQKKLMEETYLNNYGLSEGRELKKGDKYKVGIGYDLRYKDVFERQIRLGDKILINGKEMEVVQVFGKIGNPDDDSSVWIPVDTFKEIFGIGDEYSGIMAKTQDNAVPSVVAETVKKDLRKSRSEKDGEDSLYVQTSEQIVESFNTILNIVQIVVSGIAAISLIVGGVGIMNTMYTAVLERTNEIGIMKAIGARNSDILKLFLIEAGLLGMAGGIIGVILGIFLSEAVALGARTALGVDYFQSYFPWYLIVGALMFSFVVGALSGVLPAYQASRMSPVDSLRYE
ncbi:MAG: ABC transporter permease [archaeon]